MGQYLRHNYETKNKLKNNMLKILTKPLKKLYGAKIVDKDAPRPWEMTTSRSSLPYKLMVKAFNGEGNIPDFVKNNGCPWVAVSTTVTLLYPIIASIKLIGRTFDKIKDNRRVVNRESKINRIQEFLNDSTIDESDAYDSQYNDMSMGLVCRRLSDYFTIFTEDTNITLSEKLDTILYFKLHEAHSWNNYIHYRDGVFVVDNDLINEYILNNIYEAVSSEDSPFKVELIILKFILEGRFKTDDEWSEFLKGFTTQNPKHNKVQIREQKKDAKEAVKKEKIRKLCVKITNFWQSLSKVFFPTMLVAILFCAIVLVIEILFSIISFIGANGMFVSLREFGEALIAFVLVIGTSALFVYFLHGNWTKNKKVQKFFKIVFHPFVIIGTVIGAVCNALGMAMKNDCPINKFKD